jgi:hypothetical protein
MGRTQQSYLPKLNGKRTRRLTTDPAEFEPTRDGIDIDELALRLRLDSVEKRVLRESLSGKPRDVADVLGMDRSELYRINERISRKFNIAELAAPDIVTVRGNSRRLYYQDRLASGARPWALHPLDNLFRKVMSDERTGGMSSYYKF